MPNCARCEADPQPKDFGSPRGCAFKADTFGADPSTIPFNEDNWNCATITALLDAYDPDRRKTIYGDDESMQIVPVYEQGEYGWNARGWIVLTRYKSRGKVSSAVHVGDFYQPREVTLKLVEETAAYWKLQRELGRV